jgi:hypothetical protein
MPTMAVTSSGSAQVNGQRHTGYIPGSDRAGQRRGQCAKMRGIAFCTLLIIFSGHHAKSVAKIPDLRKFEVKGEEYAGAYQQIDEPARTADVTVDCGENIIQCLHGCPS